MRMIATLLQSTCAACFQQLVIDLARADDDVIDRVGIEIVDLADHRPELTHGEFIYRRYGRRCLSRLSASSPPAVYALADHLPAQHMKYLGRRGRHADLDVVFGTELEIALQSGG